MRQPPSIFNDVIGPVMVGPSSSHTAGSVRIGQMVRQMAKGNIKRVTCYVDPQSSLSAVFHSQGCDVGLATGILGRPTYDPSLPQGLEEAARQGIRVEKKEDPSLHADHPNRYWMEMEEEDGRTTHLSALSVGGGMFQITHVEEIPVDMSGGYYEGLVFLESQEQCEKLQDLLKKEFSGVEELTWSQGSGGFLLQVKSRQNIRQSLEQLAQSWGEVRYFEPVLPVLSGKEFPGLFLTAKEALDRAEGKEMWQLAAEYESIRGGISQQEVLEKMEALVGRIRSAMEAARRTPYYGDRMLQQQSHLLEEHKDRLIPGAVVQEMIKDITLMMEAKSSMGVFVAAPTAGSCGGLPGTLIGLGDTLGMSQQEIAKGMLAAGLVGVFVAQHSTFAAEVCGCQAECGAGSGMTAAGLTAMMGGSPQQCMDAAAMALQNVFGMVCDPVAGRVEVPCLGKNILAGMNALAMANLALAGFDKVVDLDQTIKALDQVGKMLPPELRCTGRAGLSITPAALEIQKKLEQAPCGGC